MKQYLRIRRTALVIVFSFGSLLANAQAPVKKWDKTFGGLNNDFLMEMQQTTDGGYILGGTSGSGNSGIKTEPNRGPAGTHDYWVIKTDLNGNKLWDRTYGGSADDFLTTIKQTQDGGYILGGQSTSGVSGDKTDGNRGNSKNDYWIVKLDANGTKIWDKTYGGTDQDQLYDLLQTPDGGYILGGASASGISGDKLAGSKGGYDYWIVRLDQNGNKLWDAAFGGNMYDGFRKILQTSDGGFVLGGVSSSDVSGDKSEPVRGLNSAYDYWVVRLDGSGLKVWDKTFGGDEGDVFTCFRQTTDGGFILGGVSGSGISGDKSVQNKGLADYWAIKTNAAGLKEWDITYGGNLEDQLIDIYQSADGGFILAGDSKSGISSDRTSASFGDADYWLVRLTQSGTKLWDKAFGGSGADSFCSFRSTTDGGYILAGYSNSNLSGDKTQMPYGALDYWIIKLGADPTGLKETAPIFNISIFPNPSQGKFQLQGNNLTTKTAEVTISDLVGRIVYQQQQIPVIQNQINQEISVPKVKGMYLLNIKAGNQTTTRKIVIE